MTSLAAAIWIQSGRLGLKEAWLTFFYYALKKKSVLRIRWLVTFDWTGVIGLETYDALFLISKNVQFRYASISHHSEHGVANIWNERWRNLPYQKRSYYRQLMEIADSFHVLQLRIGRRDNQMDVRNIFARSLSIQIPFVMWSSFRCYECLREGSVSNEIRASW